MYAPNLVRDLAMPWLRLRIATCSENLQGLDTVTIQQRRYGTILTLPSHALLCSGGSVEVHDIMIPALLSHTLIEMSFCAEWLCFKLGICRPAISRNMRSEGGASFKRMQMIACAGQKPRSRPRVSTVACTFQSEAVDGLEPSSEASEVGISLRRAFFFSNCNIRRVADLQNVR